MGIQSARPKHKHPGLVLLCHGTRGARKPNRPLRCWVGRCCVSLLDTGAPPVELSQRRSHGPTSPRHTVIACAVCSVWEEAVQRGSHLEALAHGDDSAAAHHPSRDGRQRSRTLVVQELPAPGGAPPLSRHLEATAVLLGSPAWCPEPWPGTEKALPWSTTRQSTRQALITGEGPHRLQLKPSRPAECAPRQNAPDITMLRRLVF